MEARGLRNDLDSRDSPEADKNVLRHYSFEKGLLGGFVSLDSISKSPDAILQLDSPRKSFLRCSKDRVSVLFWTASQYIEVDATSGKLARWNVAASPIVGEKRPDLQSPRTKRIFVSLRGFRETDNLEMRGLYETETPKLGRSLRLSFRFKAF